MRAARLLAILGLLFLGGAPRAAEKQRAEELRDLRFGMFVCWSFSTFSGYEWTWGVEDVRFFNPTGFDPDQWCAVAKDAGMGYLLFLTKHHDGFCLWDTATTERKVTRSPLGRDALAEVKKACDRHGLKLALYFSEGEFAWPEGGTRVDAGGTGYWRGGRNPELKKAQLKELLTKYGPIEFLWMDHAVGDGGLDHAATVAFCKSIQPGCFVGFNSGDQAGADIHLRERGRAGPAAANYALAEFTYPILEGQGRLKTRGAQWFYSLPENDGLCVSAEKILADVDGAKQHGNIFSLDVGPDRNGRIRLLDTQTLHKVGQYLRGEIPRPAPPPPAHSQGAKATASSVWAGAPGYGPEKAVDGDAQTRWGAAADARAGWLEVDLGRPQTIGRVAIDEGDWGRVEKFSVEVKQGDAWKEVAKGARLGGRKEMTIGPVEAQVVRLNILKANEVPTIHEFELRE